jgi:hypothetical protein
MNGSILHRPERVSLDRPGLPDKGHPGHQGLGSTISAGTHRRPLKKYDASCTGTEMHSLQL